MKKGDDIPDWTNATWVGSRRALILKSLKLTPRERLEALEDLCNTSNHLAKLGKAQIKNIST